ncbi:MAG: sulfatase-like hydrolase/transferase [Polyangia bacterium]
MHSPRGLGARGALVGALAGLAAGALDFGLAVGKAAAFLPSGRGRLLIFLCALYGAAGALAGLCVGLGAGGLGWATDLGPLWRRAFEKNRDVPEEAPTGARAIAYALAVVLALAALGVAIHLFALDALHRYHNRMLIAAVVGATAAGIAVGLAALVMLLAAALSPLLPFGPRVRLELRAPPAACAGAWSLGLIVGGGAVAAFLFSLESRWRMPISLKALNTGLWAPALIAGGLLIAHGGARLLTALARRLRKRDGDAPAAHCEWQRRLLFTPGGAALGIAVSLAVPTAAAMAVEWTTVRQLDPRPWLALLVAVAVATIAATLGCGRALGQLRRGGRALFAIALPGLCLLLALSSGRNDRVRKSAISFTGATGPLVQAIHAATDLDRDGYSSVLGGGDCDDFDSTVHPGAFDWPDDGIDQDCNGHQATLAPPRPRSHAAVPSSVPEAPNVMLITIDALRADHLGCYGYARPTTPNLDALARESVRFSQAWAHAPSTRYSVPAILIGRYPSTIAVNPDPRVHWPPKVLPENRLISEILKEDLGYHTSAFLSYYYFEPGWGLNQGFDDYDYHLYTLHSVGGDPAATRGSSARQLADEDIDYIAKHKDQKFFLWTHYYDTHYMFARHPDQPVTNFGDREIDLYDGEIRYTDIELGRVFDALKQAGLWDKTIIIITSDHGDGFGEHGLPKSQRHGYHLYRNETKVPLIIHVPGLPPRVVDEPVGHIDILPTLLNLLRLPASSEPQLLGDSVLGLMLGQKSPEPRKVFQEVWYEGPTSRKAVVTHDWHLIYNVVPDDTIELYDERSDPDENHDLAGDGLPEERELRSALAGWMDESALPPDFRARVHDNISKSPMTFSRKLGDTVGKTLTIEGVDVKTPSVRAGQPLELALYLHATGPIPEGYRFFTHVVGADGRQINADHELLKGLMPVWQLKPGTWLRDRIAVQLPPNWASGATRVLVGLWKTPKRAPALGPDSSDDAVRAATVTVTR